MELTRSLRSKYFLICFLTIFICFVLGYTLLVSIDKVEAPSLNELFYSIYTVYTQFGMLVFSVLVISSIASDYKDKNIMFYKLMGYNWMSYYLTKIGISFFNLSVPTILCTIVINLAYKDFSNFFIMLLYFEFVLIYQVLVTSFFGFLFQNMIMAYIANLSFWFVSMFLPISVNALYVLSYYDASNEVYLDLGNYLTVGNKEFLTIENNCIYSVVLFGIIIGLIFIFRKRWEHNGL